jgi:serine/threonine protein kinase/tetratricopeptide (TPR) repeat protein
VTNESSGNELDATFREFAGGQKVFGRYTLLKVLGRGGMGVVWLARDEELERDVALKFLPDLIVHDRALLNELKRETRRSLELTHKNIVRIHDFVFNESSGCISMEYVDGDTLSNLRLEKEQKVFATEEIAVWTSQLCDALDYAHNQARIVHRDLKPANLMVNQKGDLKISDFGIARSLGDSITRLTMEAATSSGTLVYMSPQQLDGERSTHLDDVYSLGATLYDLLTSKPPFYSGNLDRQIHERVAPSMSERRKDLNIEPASVPPIWEEVVAACLKKDPAQRPQSTAEVANRLQLASPTVGWSRTTSLARPKTKTLAVAGTALLVIVAMGGWYFGRSKFYAKPAAAVTNVISQVAALVEKSIAVLPFESFSDDKDNAYLADGVQDDILTDLAKVADLKVISRRSVAQYRDTKKSIREIGQALGVAHVLEGSVRKAAGKIHVTAQLIDTRTETQTWAEKYDRDAADIFAIQSDVSQAIVNQLKAALSPAEKAAIEEKPTQDQEAYDLYLRARALIREPGVTTKVAQGDTAKALTLLESAIARDPKFTLAYCLLSEAQLNLFGVEFWNYERLPKAKEAIEAALRISPNSPSAHLSMAYYLYRAVRDRDSAEKELAIAAAGLPGDVDLIALRATIAAERGQWPSALRECEKALELDPREQETAQNLVTLYTGLRRYADAEKVSDHMIATSPQQSTGPFWRQKSKIALAKGDSKAAMAAMDANPNRNIGLPGLNTEVANILFMQRQYGKAEEILRSIDDVARTHNVMPKGGDNPGAQGFGFQLLGRIARAQGQEEKARGYFESARKGHEAWLAKNPAQATVFEARSLAYIAEEDAALGRKEDALREAHHVLELWPLSRDAIVAPDIATIVAVAYLWVGDRDAAMQLLQQFAKLPNGPTAGDLKLNPVWDEIRGDPRFDKIIADAAEPVKLD